MAGAFSTGLVQGQHDIQRKYNERQTTNGDLKKSTKRDNVMKLHLIKLRKFLILANGQKNLVELISMLVIYLQESAIGVTKLREIECRRPSERELKWFSKLEPINLKENISQVKTHLLRERKFNLIKIEVLLCMSLRI